MTAIVIRHCVPSMQVPACRRPSAGGARCHNMQVKMVTMEQPLVQRLKTRRVRFRNDVLKSPMSHNLSGADYASTSTFTQDLTIFLVYHRFLHSSTAFFTAGRLMLKRGKVWPLPRRHLMNSFSYDVFFPFDCVLRYCRSHSGNANHSMWWQCSHCSARATIAYSKFHPSWRRSHRHSGHCRAAGG